jgi:hypothetical protein
MVNPWGKKGGIVMITFNYFPNVAHPTCMVYIKKRGNFSGILSIAVQNFPFSQIRTFVTFLQIPDCRYPGVFFQSFIEAHSHLEMLFLGVVLTKKTCLPYLHVRKAFYFQNECSSQTPVSHTYSYLGGRDQENDGSEQPGEIVHKILS